MSEIILSQLAEPFPPGDIEWRVARQGRKRNREIFCVVFAYVTARAIAKRLDDVVGPENWCNTRMAIHEMRVNVNAIEVGISIRIGGEWVTKYDVAEPTDIEPAKGGFSGAMKRAGVQWGIARYLHLLGTTYATVSEEYQKGWEPHRLSDKDGGDYYYWEPPTLPSWALPSIDSERTRITFQELKALKTAWMKKLAPTEDDSSKLASGFSRWVAKYGGDFNVHEPECWTRNLLLKCNRELALTKHATGPSADVPFD